MTPYRWVTYAAVVCAAALIAKVGLSVRKPKVSASRAELLNTLSNPSDNGTVDEMAATQPPDPRTWPVPGSHVIQYRFTTGPTGVESSLN